MITEQDQNIINIINSYKYFRYKFVYKKLDDEQINYIINRYSDTSSYKENIIRIYNNIEERPKCPICGNYCELTNKNIYGKTCGKQYCHTKIISLETKNTCLEKYKVDCVLKVPKYNEKFKKTWKSHTKEKTNEIINKRKSTCLEKYGVDNKAKLEETKQKMFKTNLKKYGHICSIYGKEQQEKSKITCQTLYGTNYSTQAEIVKNKQIETKRKNNTFNTSNPENKSYNLLKEKYQDIQYQYKSKLYPFICDFYIPSLDLYIECNYHWTHGGKPFENTNEDNLIVEEWKNKNTKFYNNAINTWTIRDVKKRNIAKENKLNYLVFYNINELKEWLNI